MLHLRDLQKNTDVNFKISIKENICLTTIPEQYHYYIYFVPKDFDTISNIQIENKGENKVITVELLIDDIVSCKVDNNLKIINCATHSRFAFKIYFKVEKQCEIRLFIKYDLCEFRNEFKRYLIAMPFQTDTHIYVDNKVESIITKE